MGSTAAPSPRLGIDTRRTGVLFALGVTTVEDWAVVAVVGELELATAPKLRQQIVTLVGDGRTRILIDLQQVDFVDSIGLGILVSALKRVRGRDGQLVITGPKPRVRVLFDLVRLPEIIDVYDTLDEAMDAVRDRPPTPTPTTGSERTHG
jgi:anti-sigma B factor antagonist